MGDGVKGKGQNEKLKEAFDAAWEDAKGKGALPGIYDAKIQVETKNPIHAYIVTISPPDGD